MDVEQALAEDLKRLEGDGGAVDKGPRPAIAHHDAAQQALVAVGDACSSSQARAAGTLRMSKVAGHLGAVGAGTDGARVRPVAEGQTEGLNQDGLAGPVSPVSTVIPVPSSSSRALTMAKSRTSSRVSMVPLSEVARSSRAWPAAAGSDRGRRGGSGEGPHACLAIRTCSPRRRATVSCPSHEIWTCAGSVWPDTTISTTLSPATTSGRLGKGMGADRHQDQGVEGRVQQGASTRQGVGRRAGGRCDDQPSERWVLTKLPSM